MPDMNMMGEMPSPDNHEAAMARADLYKLANYSFKLFKMIRDGQELEGWVQAKITKAADYIASVYHFMEYEMKFSEYGEKLETSDVYTEDVKREYMHKLTEARVKLEKLRRYNIQSLKEGKDDERGGDDDTPGKFNVKKTEKGTQYTRKSKSFSDEPEKKVSKTAPTGAERRAEKSKDTSKADSKNWQARFGKGSVTKHSPSDKEPTKKVKEEVEIAESITHIVAKSDLQKHKDWMDSEGFDTKTKPLPSSHPKSKTHVGIVSGKDSREHGYHSDGHAVAVSKKVKEGSIQGGGKPGEGGVWTADAPKKGAPNVPAPYPDEGPTANVKAGAKPVVGKGKPVVGKPVAGKPAAAPVREALKGGQKKLDVAEPKGKIDSKDMAALRATKKVKEAEDKKCNHTAKGKSCPVHGLKECGMSEGIIKELKGEMHDDADSILKHIDPAHHSKYKPYLKKGVYKGGYADRSAVLKAAEKAGHVAEPKAKDKAKK